MHTDNNSYPSLPLPTMPLPPPSPEMRDRGAFATIPTPTACSNNKNQPKQQLFIVWAIGIVFFSLFICLSILLTYVLCISRLYYLRRNYRKWAVTTKLGPNDSLAIVWATGTYKERVTTTKRAQAMHLGPKYVLGQ